MISINGIELVLLNKKYWILFAIMIIIFSLVYIFEWNLILFPDIYIRYDLWTPVNILFLTIISILSSLAITLSIFNLKIRISSNKRVYGYFGIVPALLTSACPGCAPLLLSFTSTTFAIGLSLAQFGTIIKILAVLILSITIFYLSSSVNRCRVKKINRR